MMESWRELGCALGIAQSCGPLLRQLRLAENYHDSIDQSTGARSKARKLRALDLAMMKGRLMLILLRISGKS